MAGDRLSKEEVVRVLRAAAKAGSVAASARVKALMAAQVSAGKNLESFGGSTMTLDVDGRTSLGRLLASLDEPGIRVEKAYGSGQSLHLRYAVTWTEPVCGQEWSIWEDANQAARLVIEDGLGIKVFVMPYSS